MTVFAKHINFNKAINNVKLDIQILSLFPVGDNHLISGGCRFCRCCSNAETYSAFGKMVMSLSLNLLQSRYMSSSLHHGGALDHRIRSGTGQRETSSLSSSSMKMST